MPIKKKKKNYIVRFAIWITFTLGLFIYIEYLILLINCEAWLNL
jgi:hypothetical protein